MFQKVVVINYCIVMERLGDSLNKFIKFFENKLSLTTIVHIAMQLVMCLKKIHEYGYVYNDLKPDNILVGNVPILQYLNQDGASNQAQP